FRAGATHCTTEARPSARRPRHRPAVGKAEGAFPGKPPTPEQLAAIQEALKTAGIECYGRWLALGADGPDLLQPFPSDPMAIWPISTRVNSPKNDDADLLEPFAEADACWPKDGK
ncbi:MAG: hypothetical protein ACJ8CX_18005, partial [Microvirga sp.]